MISTVLGTCVAACIYDPVSRIGGMNHIFLPGKPESRNIHMPFRYSHEAMRLLIKKVLSEGAMQGNLLAKVFGGGHVLSSINGENGVGERIAADVTQFLAKECIRVAGKDLGGNEGRRIQFHTDTGEVYLRRIKQVHLKSL